MSNEKRFFIVNDWDRPEERLIVECRGERYYYIHPDYEKSFKHGMTSNEATAVEDFGVSIEIDTNGVIHGEVVKKSVARYPDGISRRWQGSSEFSFQTNCEATK